MTLALGLLILDILAIKPSTTKNIADNAIFSGNIASGQVDQHHIASGAIYGYHINDGEIINAKIDNEAVQSGNIASGQVGQFHISSGAITSGRLGVTGTPTGSLFLRDDFTWQAAGGGLSSGIVQSGHIGNNAVTSGNIASGQIFTYHLASGTAATISQFSAPFISGTAWTLATEEIISGVRAVALSESGLLRIALANNASRMPAIGIVVDNVASGRVANVYTAGVFQATSGLMDYSGFIGQNLWINTSGILSPNLANDSYIGPFEQCVGVAMSDGRAIIKVDSMNSPGTIMSGMNISLLNNDAGYITDIGYVVSGDVAGFGYALSGDVYYTYVTSGDAYNSYWSSGTMGGLFAISGTFLTSGDIASIGYAISGDVANDYVNLINFSGGLWWGSGNFGGQFAMSGSAGGLTSGAVQSGHIASGAVEGFFGLARHIVSGTVGSFDLGSGAVNSGHIASGAVNALNIAENTVAGIFGSIPHIASGTVGGTDITPGTIHGALGAWQHIMSGTIGNFDIASGQVDNFHVASGAITSGRLGVAGTPTGSLFLRDDFTWAAAGGGLTSGAVQSGHVASGVVQGFFGTTRHIASGTIGVFDFGSGAILSGAIASGQIGFRHLANGAVQSGSIASGAISTFHFSSGAVLSGNIASGQIGLNHIASGAVLSGHIASGQISTYKLASGTAATISQFSAPFVSGTAWTAITEEMISGVRAVAFSQSGTLRIAMASISGRMPAVGIVVENVASGIAANVYTAGAIQFTSGMADYSGYLGQTVFVGRSGQIVTTSGSFNSGGLLSGNIIQPLGQAWTSGGAIIKVDYPLVDTPLLTQIQTGNVTLTGTTTNVTQTEIFIGGVASSRISIASDSTYMFEVRIAARRTDADNESAAYLFQGCIDNNAGTTALVGSLNKVVIAEDTAAWDVDVQADNTNDALIVLVTGENSKTIRWTALVTIVEAAG